MLLWRETIVGRLFVEVRLDLSRWIQGAKGTADVIVHSDNTLHIIDLKYGKGVKVSAIDNSQLKLYALSAYYSMRDAGFQIDKVMLHIAQPRLDHFQAWEFPLDEIPIFGDQVSTWVNLCLDKQVEYNPSDYACQWCKAKATCPALYEHNTAIISQDFEDLTPPAPDTLTDEQLKKIIDNKPLIEKWLKAVESHIFTKLEHGESFPGYKMVEGRSFRKYNDNAEQILKNMLGSNAYEQKLIGITQAEKLIGKKQFNELGITYKPIGKPTLALESDKRQAISTISDDFKNLND